MDVDVGAARQKSARLQTVLPALPDQILLLRRRLNIHAELDQCLEPLLVRGRRFHRFGPVCDQVTAQHEASPESDPERQTCRTQSGRHATCHLVLHYEAAAHSIKFSVARSPSLRQASGVQGRLRSSKRPSSGTSCSSIPSSRPLRRGSTPKRASRSPARLCSVPSASHQAGPTRTPTLCWSESWG